jgi:putative peptidoglycan lipid II flippase
VRRVLHSFGPVVVGRGVVQLSAYVDTAIASLLGARALSTLVYAQTIYLIPVSLFGMSVSAAALTEMSRDTAAGEAAYAKLRERITSNARRIAFLVVPSAAAFLFLGDVIGAALLQTGRFTAADTRYLWYLLMGSAVGLVASTQGRLYASAFYALKDPTTPLRYAIVRVALTTVLAWSTGMYLPGLLGIPAHLGGAFITMVTGLVAWLEAYLLHRKLVQKVGPMGLPKGFLARLWTGAVLAGLVGVGLKLAFTRFLGPMHGLDGEWAAGLLVPPRLHPVVAAGIILPVFGVLYFAVTAALGVSEATGIFRKVLRRLGR